MKKMLLLSMLLSVGMVLLVACGGQELASSAKSLEDAKSAGALDTDNPTDVVSTPEDILKENCEKRPLQPGDQNWCEEVCASKGKITIGCRYVWVHQTFTCDLTPSCVLEFEDKPTFNPHE